MIPEELRSIDQWLRWEKKQMQNGKFTKIPITLEGYPASVTDPLTWTSYHKVRAFPRIGFVFTEESGIGGIDLDKVLKAGKLKEWALQIVKEANSYTEISPSFEGLHILGYFSKPDWMPTRIDMPENTGLEIYTKARFFTMTGNIFENYSLLREIDISKILNFLEPAPIEEPVRKNPIDPELYDVDILAIAPGLKIGVNQPHPFHESTSGANFLLNHDGSWRCWRHSCTGTPLRLLGIRERIIRCGEEPNDEQWYQIFQEARKEGLIPDQRTLKKQRLERIPEAKIRRAL